MVESAHSLWRTARSWNGTFVASFNACFFLGLVILSLYGENAVQAVPPERFGAAVFAGVPLMNGLLTVLAVLALDRFLGRRRYLRATEGGRHQLALTAFLAGGAGILTAMSVVGMFAVTSMIVYATFSNIRAFGRKMGELLQAGSVAGKKDVSLFFNFFLNLVITFTVVNLSLNEAHHSLGLPWGFNFGENIAGIIDSLYFTVITMVTAGYGDIVPQTPMAKLVVVLECLTSYVMLGLMIGIISRGVDFNK